MAASFALMSSDVDSDVLRLLGIPAARFQTDDLSTLLDVCRNGELCTVLPDVAVEGSAGLRRAPEPQVSPLPIFALRRKRLVDVDLVDQALEAISARLPLV
jgi:DNA-binding transcriptional LysR family regulator